MALARAFAQGPRPKRSLLFVWHAGEERGLYGSRYFADYPTVPLDRIVAQLNIDMIGRNRDDKTSEANTVYLVGSDRISSELHQINRDANQALQPPLKLDYEMNDPSDPEQVYYRSDHYSYAAKGIPIIFFTTGLHPDYHANTDEVSKIEFAKMTRVTQLVYETGGAWPISIMRPCATTRGRGPERERRSVASAAGHLPHHLRQSRRLRHHHSAAAVLRGEVRRVAAGDRLAVRRLLAVPAGRRAGARRFVGSVRPAAGADLQPARHRRQLRHARARAARSRCCSSRASSTACRAATSRPRARMWPTSPSRRIARARTG